MAKAKRKAKKPWKVLSHKDYARPDAPAWPKKEIQAKWGSASPIGEIKGLTIARMTSVFGPPTIKVGRDEEELFTRSWLIELDDGSLIKIHDQTYMLVPPDDWYEDEDGEWPGPSKAQFEKYLRGKLTWEVEDATKRQRPYRRSQAYQREWVKQVRVDHARLYRVVREALGLSKGDELEKLRCRSLLDEEYEVKRRKKPKRKSSTKEQRRTLAQYMREKYGI
jgi:hypothetical protein